MGSSGTRATDRDTMTDTNTEGLVATGWEQELIVVHLVQYRYREERSYGE